MAKRSLKASEAGRIKAKQAFERTGWTQEYLAYQVGLGTRQSIWKFFTGRPIDRSIFVDLCFQLDLEWEEIVDSPVVKPKAKTLPSTDLSVSLIKTQLKDILLAPLPLTTGAFDICQPLPLHRLYTAQYFLSSMQGQRWLDLHELTQPSGSLHQPPAKIAANLVATQFAQNTQKLVILGGPGAGKTTLLHHLASQCLEAKLCPEHIPVWISLRSFVAQYDAPSFPTLNDYLEQRLRTQQKSSLSISNLLKDGRFLILLDGLDEVSIEARSPLCHTIQSWAQVYGNNRFILTCRTAAQQFRFQGFTYAELAEFGSAQIEQFVQQFFELTSSPFGAHKARDFLEQIHRKPNQPIRDLVTTPILLNLVCSIFQARRTLPSNRAKLYQAALEILMDQWDAARGITREQADALTLSKADRLKLLSDVAFKTFEKEQFFFDRQDLLHLITESWQPNLSDGGASLDPETRWAQGEQIIRAIAAHNGLFVERAKDIYAFSHLTFQEYLTARNIVATPDKSALAARLEALATKVRHDHWREVIVLTANLLPEPLAFLQLLQHHSFEIIGTSPKIQAFLQMIQAKTKTLESPYPQWTLRAFYFSTLTKADLNLAFEPLFAAQLSPELALDLSLINFWNALEQVRENALMSRILKLYSAFNFETQHTLRPDFRTAIQTLKSELPTYQNGKRSQQHWWQQEGNAWIARWDEMVQRYRGLSLSWQWSPKESQTLRSYYRAMQLMVDCLQVESRLTEAERSFLMSQLWMSLLEQTTDQSNQKQTIESHQYRHDAFAPT